MNEANSDVMLAPALALWTAWYFEQRDRQMMQAFGLISLSTLLLADLVGLVLGKGIRNEFDKFWSPLMALVFLAILVAQMKQIRTLVAPSVRTDALHDDAGALRDTAGAKPPRCVGLPGSGSSDVC